MDKLQRLKDFEALKISVASPEKVLSWSYGEVTKPETINYRTFRAEKDGLFDERIFGPTKDFECYCGKYKRIRYKGIVCDKCGVEVTRKKVRRERMGHVKLAAPVAHAWYFRGVPSKLGLLLDISPRLLESVIYFSRYMVVAVDYAKRAKVVAELEKELASTLASAKAKYKEREDLQRKEASQKVKAIQVTDKEQLELAKEELLHHSRKKLAEINEQFLHETAEIENTYQGMINSLEKIEERSILAEEDYFMLAEMLEKFAQVGMGAEAVRTVLEGINLDRLAKELSQQMLKVTGQKKTKLVKRIGVVESLREGQVRPEWMVLTVLPIIPPDLRPMVQLEGGRFATSDLNDLYRAVINRNNRLKRLLDLGAPEIIVRNEKRMLQESVDALIDSGKVQRYRVRRSKQALRSLTDMLKGKQGRFRQNLLGKRVDYSGRSVVVPGPSLALSETGLPKEMALELFKPFVIREILLDGYAPNPKSARYFLEGRSREVWDALERVVQNYPVLLNRAPTLHRLGILAFFPRLIEGNAIQLHPCVCSGFNADFDGDQMSVHVPLSKKARAEACTLMLSAKNLLKPADGDPIAVPVKEMALGTYYLTSIDPKITPHRSIFGDPEEVLMALDCEAVFLKQQIKMYYQEELLDTSPGRVLINQVIPESLRFYNDVIDKKVIKKLVDKSIVTEPEDVTVKFIDAIKNLGFKYSTLSGVSVSIFDNVISPKREEVLHEAEKKALEVSKNYERGLITKKEKAALLEGVWMSATRELDELTWQELDEDNDVKVIVNAGASRASREQVKQLGGMKGLVYDVSGNVVELPIKSNFRKGLSGLEYFTGARAARKALADTALKTADSGYLTRKLVDVSQEVLITEIDCGTNEGYKVRREQQVALSSYAERLFGRVAAAMVKDGTGKILVKKNGLITAEIAERIDQAGLDEIIVRSPISCESEVGVCSMCYGLDLANRRMVRIGTPIGVVAAQSIGEPGTQLTLRTFHTGGIVGKDITQGLPRITELFEARTPKFKAVTSEVAGVVKIKEKEGEVFAIVQPQGKGDPVEYQLPKILDMKVKDGDLVGVGTPLTEGYLDPKILIKEVGIRETQRYLLEEIQNVYSSQGVAVNDKHTEVILRQMFAKVVIDDLGDSSYIPGDVVNKTDFAKVCAKLKNKKLPTAKPLVMGITKAALRTDSFLAAASFQETSRVLTEASMSGKVDRLHGLKENVIIGRRIPVGDFAPIPEDEVGES